MHKAFHCLVPSWNSELSNSLLSYKRNDVRVDVFTICIRLLNYKENCELLIRTVGPLTSPPRQIKRNKFVLCPRTFIQYHVVQMSGRIQYGRLACFKPCYFPTQHLRTTGRKCVAILTISFEVNEAQILATQQQITVTATREQKTLTFRWDHITKECRK
jgi:hypothetical protein